MLPYIPWCSLQFSSLLLRTTSTMSDSMKSVLIIGFAQVPPNNQSSENSQWTPEAIQGVIEKEMQKGEQAGFHMQNYAMPLDKASSLDLDDLKGILRSRKWSGVSIGFGIRGNVDLTSLFEHLVNACVTEVSPPPKFMFNTWPTTIFEALERSGL